MNELPAGGLRRIETASFANTARTLAPAIAGRAREAEALRRIPDETVREFESADLCRVWIPKIYGGLEADLHAGIDSMFEIGRACSSTSWCLSVWQQHSWLVAHFPESAQKETLAADPDFHIAAVLAPRGKAKQVDGGFRLSGFWPFASGCEHGTWVLLGALVTDEEGAEIPLGREISGLPAQNARLCLVPVGDVTIMGDWDAAGLAGTGSHSIKVDDVFVPEHRTMLIADAAAGDAPGSAIHDGPLYHTSYYAFLHTALSGPAPGIAQGAVDHLIEAIDGKRLMPQNQLQMDLTRTHRQIGEAEGKIHAARLMLRDSADLIMAAAAAGHRLTAAERAHCRRNGNMSTQLCYEATELAFFAGGGSQLAMRSPIQRAMRDMHGVKAHYFMDLETAYELAGLSRLGRTPFTYAY